LFSEETTTVLVFQDGAVIRLAAPVTVGQLIFLTNKRSKQEVVCQVLRQRSSSGGLGYVELKFTEEREAYWGVVFPKGPRSASAFEATEHLQAEATTAQPTEIPVAPHSVEDVDKLKREVEALREQLTALEEKTVQAASPKPVETPSQDELPCQNTKAVESQMGQAPKHKEERAPVNDATSAPAPAESTEPTPTPPALLMPTSVKDASETAPPIVSMSLPVWSMGKSPEEQLLEEEAAQATTITEASEPERTDASVADSADELLPKPELDFSQMKESGSTKERGNAKPPKSPKVASSNLARTVGLAAVLVLAVGGGAWYGKWWQYLPLTKRTAVPAVIPHPVVHRPAVASAKPANPVNAPSSPSSIAQAADGSTKTALDNTAAANKATPPKSVENESAVAEKRSVREKPSVKTEAVKVEEQPSAAEAPSDVAPQSAKLVKSVNPVYPPDAMRSYITGDIKAEVTVLPSGHVGDVKVISGPKALRDAAVDALKQYQYSPATQGGKPVESKAIEVVKFWFNP
jgi:protein TonB